MTRKDYELIASVFNERLTYLVECSQRPSASEEYRQVRYDQHCEVRFTAKKMALALAEQNPAFDRDRFLRACGVA